MKEKGGDNEKRGLLVGSSMHPRGVPHITLFDEERQMQAGISLSSPESCTIKMAKSYAGKSTFQTDVSRGP